MSSVARVLLARGFAVSGSDLKESQTLEGVRRAGARVFVGHSPDQIPPDADTVVVSSAIPPDNIELTAARDSGIPVLTRTQVLAGLMRGSRAIVVAGTHGKTTTTSMIAAVLAQAGLAPTFVIGGDLNESGSGAGHGSGDVFVAESDESDGSFLLFEPDIAVITNVEEDHLDYYSGQEELEAAFRTFAGRAGTIVACRDDPGAGRALEGIASRVIWYGAAEGSELRIRNVEVTPRGATALIERQGPPASLGVSVPGRQNLWNATAALAVALELGVDPEVASRAIEGFSGVRRRFERRGSAAGARFVDDYAHHPTEVAATIETARLELGRNGPGALGGAARGRVVAVFQPHRYTRTRALGRGLGESLAGADVVVLTEVYAAGEAPIPGVNGKLVVEALTEAAPGKRVVYLPRRSDVVPFLLREVRRGDLVVTIGAGDVTMVGEETLRRLREAEAVTAREGTR
jgi:UDP-N-acetylmuramate--alanine ligase